MKPPMKRCRHGAPGAEKPGLVDADGRIRDLAAHVADIDAAAIGPAGLARLAAIDPASLPLVEDGVRYGPCVTGTRHFVANGPNSANHATESYQPSPEEPDAVKQCGTSIPGPKRPDPHPKGSQ